jgi:prepilin-type N-terminal cleavage/methylation domain-containing protein
VTRRGMTLVEVLGSLALLGALALASLAWTRVAINGTAAALLRLRWERSAAAVLDLIGDDLRTGDACARELKVRADSSGAVLVVRGRGSVNGRVCAIDRVYRRDPGSGELQREDRNSGLPGTGAEPALLVARSLLGEVRSATFSMDDRSGVLSVTIDGPGAVSARREYVLP